MNPWVSSQVPENHLRYNNTQILTKQHTLGGHPERSEGSFVT